MNYRSPLEDVELASKLQPRQAAAIRDDSAGH
jgi:hypothetical protein